MDHPDEFEFGRCSRSMELCNLVRSRARKSIKNLGPCTGEADLLTWPCKSKDQQEGKETVLDHIIMDMMGSSVTVENFANAAVHRSFCRKRRLLDRTNTVLVSRLAIMILVAFMLVIATSVTWYCTSAYSKRSIRSVAYVLRQQILRSSLQTLTILLGQAYNMSRTLSSLHQEAFESTHNQPWNQTQEEIRRINWAFFQSQQQLSAVGFRSHKGYMTEYSRIGRLEYLLTANQSVYNASFLGYLQNITGSFNGLGKAIPSPIKKVPYPAVKQEVIWNIEPGISGEPFVSSAVPVRTSGTKKSLGVSVLSTPVGSLTRYLSSVDLLGGFLYVTWKNGTMIAGSYNNSIDAMQDARNASNHFVAAAAQFLGSNYGHNTLANRETHNENVILMDRKFYIDTLPIGNSIVGNLQLTAVLIVPRASVMGKVESQQRTVVGVSVGIAIGFSIVGCIVICGLTSKMSTEMQLRQEVIRLLVAKHRAEQSSNYKSQFLANMSHELRTPMAGIIGLLDLLSCDTLTTEQEYSVSQIRLCATGLLTLLDNVLDISKVEGGKMELEMSPFNLAEELESLVDMHAAQSNTAGIEIILDLSDEIPQVVGDSFRVRQIFSNLLSNSVKFTKEGYIIIRGWMDQSLLHVGSSHRSHQELLTVLPRVSSFGGLKESDPPIDDKIALVFEIEDTGCGIPAQLHDSIFDAFVQEDSSSTRTHGGSGLGLYIVRSLVWKMGGEIQVASKQGPGTLIRFHIVLERENNTGERVSNLPSPQSLASLLSSPTKIQLPPVDILEHTQVVVAMPDSITANFAVGWLEKRGLKVSRVKIWQDIAPKIESLCRPFTVASKDMRKTHAGYFSDITDSSMSPFDCSSGACSSHASEGMMDLTSFPLLALIDVALFPCIHSAGCSGFHGDGMCKDILTNRVDAQRIISPPLLDVLSFLSKINSRHPLAIGWVVAPDSGGYFKKILQGPRFSTVVVKPLHSTRMKCLLSILNRVYKLVSEPVSPSSGPSTPRLGTTCKEAFSSPDNQVLVQGNTWLMEKVSEINQQNIQSATTYNRGQEFKDITKLSRIESVALSKADTEVLAIDTSLLADHFEDYMLSTPDSPTSGLLTPEVANTLADGMEIRKERVHPKDLEDEWRGPVIEVTFPTKLKPSQKLIPGRAFSLPESECNTMPSTANSSPVHTSAAGTPRMSNRVLAGMQILLVEDTLFLQRVVSTMLKKLGARVTVVSDGLQAVNIVTQFLDGTVSPLQDASFDLILMDCAMPVMDGYSATQRIRDAERKTGQHIPIVALTAHALSSDEEKCLAAGMDAYLTKPINYELLVKTIEGLVKKGHE